MLVRLGFSLATSVDPGILLMDEGIGAGDARFAERASQRLGDSQKEFSGVLKALRDGADALEPFRKELADQITYLGSDLTPSAMESLKPNAEKLNVHGKEAFGKADAAIATANSYFQGLRSTES